jgi:hypothetical protein
MRVTLLAMKRQRPASRRADSGLAQRQEQDDET